jgi:Sensors of blue-light using FAD
MGLVQLVYSSRPFGFDESVLAGILLIARRNNPRAGVTGALICRADVYMQMLEGEADVVALTYARIKADDRHLEIQTRLHRPAPERLFPHWAMLDDNGDGWFWTQGELEQGALDQVSPDDILDVFAHVRDIAPKPGAIALN